MTNHELKKAADNLAGLARDLERYDPWGGTRSRSDAADLRLILAANRKMRITLETIANNSPAGARLSYSSLSKIARSALSTKEQPDV